MKGVHICSFSDPQDYKIYVENSRRGGRTYRFDFSERFGPMVIGVNGREVAQPGPQHPFWKSVTLWHRQGKRVGGRWTVYVGTGTARGLKRFCTCREANLRGQINYPELVKR